MRFLLPFTVLLLAGCAGAQAPLPQVTLIAPQQLPTSSFTDPILIEGEANYNLYCAHCHGYNGEGQLQDTIENTLNLGMMTVPPHDHTGHTWQHPEALLVKVIMDGVPNPLAMYPMPAYAGILTESQAKGILKYISLWWTADQREHQRQVTENWRAAGVILQDSEALRVAPSPTPTN